MMFRNQVQSTTSFSHWSSQVRFTGGDETEWAVVHRTLIEIIFILFISTSNNTIHFLFLLCSYLQCTGELNFYSWCLCDAMQCNAMLQARQHIHHIPLMCFYMCYCVIFIFIPVDRLPDVLKAESYAFVALPAEAFWDGQVNSENIKKGILCPIRDLPKTGWIHGITLFSKVCPTVTSSITF